jgi:phosphate transport system substrate-binding protein
MRLGSFWSSLLLAGSCLWAQDAPRPERPVAVCSYDMEPLMLLWMDQLQTEDPQFKLDLRSNVATEVAKALIEGRSLLAPLNREFKPEELAAFSARWGYPPTRMAIGVDALVVLVQKDNPLREIRIEQLDAIWTTSRLGGWPKDIRFWGDLGLTASTWRNRAIVCLDRPEGDGLRDYFQQTITQGGNNKSSNRKSADAMSLVGELVANPAAIGYGSMGEVFNNLRTVPVVPLGGRNAVEPSNESVASGEYPLTRIMYVYFNRAPNRPIEPTVLQFLRFLISPAGQKELAPMGFVPLPQDVMLMNKKRLDN